MPSDEGEEEDEEITSNRSDDDGEEGEKHLRMLQEVTGMPAEAFDGNNFFFFPSFFRAKV